MTWDLDAGTVGWLVFIAYFAVWELITSHMDGKEMLTHHLQEVFHLAPVTWFIALGLWLWMGPHFLAPTLESWLASSVWQR